MVSNDFDYIFRLVSLSQNQSLALKYDENNNNNNILL